MFTFNTPRVAGLKSSNLNNNNRMCVCVCACACVRACAISEELNKKNGKSYGTGFFGKVQR